MKCIPQIHEVLVGVTYGKAAIVSLVSTAVGFGLGWYVKGRGMFGVKIDLQNAKDEIVALKNKLGEAVAQPKA